MEAQPPLKLGGDANSDDGERGSGGTSVSPGMLREHVVFQEHSDDSAPVQPTNIITDPRELQASGSWEYAVAQVRIYYV